MRRHFFSFVLLLLLLGLPRSLDASHFRFGHLSWQRSASGDPLEIDVTVVEAWRSNTAGPGSLIYTLDHSGANFSSVGATQIGSLTDITGEQYDIFSKTVTFTFPSNGVYTITSTETFRLIDVVNAQASNAKLQLVLDLRNTNTGTPTTTSPVILQLPINTTNVVPIPLVDPDNDPINVRFASVVESGIPAIPEVGGNQLSVSSTGVLNWNTTGGAIGQRFAVQLAIEENHPGFTTTGRVPLEFIIELVNISTNDPPTCTGPTNTMNAEVGTPLTFTFQATDPEGGPLSVTGQQLPPGASLSPASGTTNASPFTVQLTWVPAVEHLGQSFPVSVLFTDDHGLQANCGFTISVSSILPLPSFDLVSVESGGLGSSGGRSANPAISTGARYVVFTSDGPNLVTNDFNVRKDVFRRDRGLGETRLISVNRTGRSANADSVSPVISADGRFVAYESRASDIVANDNNNAIDVFVYDASSNSTFIVSAATNGGSAAGDSFAPRFSHDGKRIVFVSTADNLTANDTNGTSDIFLFDLDTGTTTLISVSTNGWSGAGASSSPSIATNGNFVAFASAAPDLAAIDLNNHTDIFWRDLNNNATFLISANTNGRSGNSISFDPAISPAGDRIAFASRATDLVALPDNNLQTDVFYRDVSGAAILPVSRNRAGTAMGNGGSSTPVFDRSGSNVLFVSIATDLTVGDSNGAQDVFLWNVASRAHELISVNSAGTATGNGASGITAASISADLRYVAFFSEASDLVPSADNNNASDVYVRDRREGVTKLISYDPVNSAIGNSHSFAPFISSDGSVIVFATDASNLAANDVNVASDIVATSLSNALPSSVALTAQASAPLSVPLGSEFRATLSVVNYSPAPVTAVNVAALMSRNVECLSASGDGSFDADREVWTVDSIPSLGSASLELLVRTVAGESGYVAGEIIYVRESPRVAGVPIRGASFNITAALQADLVGPMPAATHTWRADLANGNLRSFPQHGVFDGRTTTIEFNADLLGALPTRVGVSVADVGEGARFEAFDGQGRSLIVSPLAAGQFVGVESENGIGRIELTGVAPSAVSELLAALDPGVPVPAGLLIWQRGEVATAGEARSLTPTRPLGGDAVTLEFWLAPGEPLDALSPWTPLAVSVAPGEDFNSLARGPDIYYAWGSLCFSVPVVNGAVRELVVHEVDLPVGRRHHIAGVVDQGRQTLYLDGQVVASRALTAPVTFSAAAIRIGAVPYSGLARDFSGTFGGLALFDRALPPATLSALANPLGRGKVSPDLRAQREDGATLMAWPSFFSGYRLQSAASLTGGWQDWPAPAVLRNGAWQVSIPASSVHQYYRLTR